MTARHLRAGPALMLCIACNDPVCGQVAGRAVDVDLVATGADTEGYWTWREMLSVVREPGEFDIFWEHRARFLTNWENADHPDATPEWIDGTQMVLFWWRAAHDDPVRTATDFYDVDGTLVVDFLVKPRCYPDEYWPGITEGILIRTPILDNPTQCDIQSLECEDFE